LLFGWAAAGSVDTELSFLSFLELYGADFKLKLDKTNLAGDGGAKLLARSSLYSAVQIREGTSTRVATEIIFQTLPQR
jgi:hypothetical protein